MKRKVRMTLEALESRLVLTGDFLLFPINLPIHSIDGTDNNLANPDWGSTNIQLLRLAPADYSDGLSAPAGADRLSPRVISNAVADQGGEDIISDRFLSAMIYAWGQFIDHDIDLTPTGDTETLSIPVPAGDPYFDPSNSGTATIDTTRSVFDPTTGTTDPRQQINTITAWIDGSTIYGSDPTTAASLREFSGGRLKTSAGDLLPIGADGFFQAGDVRANENIELTSLHTLFVREHNYWADRIATDNPTLSDEQIYQFARSIVIGEIQSITFNQWLPSLLGPGVIAPYTGYDPTVNPGISNEFSTAAFRFGHSLLGDDIEFIGNDGNEVADEISLSQAFFNPEPIQTLGIDPILKYLTSDPSSEVDTKVVDSVRNFLFGPPGAGGLDLASLNIARGRDHGLSSYNATREAIGLSRVGSFAEISSDPDVQAALASVYKTVGDVDLWVGALAEDHVPGGSVGETLQTIISDQFERLRDGDRLWYQNVFKGDLLRQIQNTTLSDIIERNTNLTTIQDNAFFFRASVSGTVFADGNHNGQPDKAEPGLTGRTIELVNADGEVVATTTTDGQGRYSFDVADGLRTGDYQVQMLTPDGGSVELMRSVSIVSGEVFLKRVDFAVAPPQGNHPPGDGHHHDGPGAPPPPPRPNANPPRMPSTNGGARQDGPAPGVDAVFMEAAGMLGKRDGRR